MEEMITKLIQLVESASPMLWEIARRQVILNMIWIMIPIILFVGIGIGCICFGRQQWNKHRKKEEEAKTGVDENNWGHFSDDYITFARWWFAGAWISVLIAFGYLVYLFGFIFNPKYYAIQKLIQLIK